MKTIDLYAVMIKEEEDIEGKIMIVFDDKEMAEVYKAGLEVDPQYQGASFYIEHTKGIIFKTSKEA